MYTLKMIAIYGIIFFIGGGRVLKKHTSTFYRSYVLSWYYVIVVSKEPSLALRPAALRADRKPKLGSPQGFTDQEETQEETKVSPRFHLYLSSERERVRHYLIGPSKWSIASDQPLKDYLGILRLDARLGIKDPSQFFQRSDL